MLFFKWEGAAAVHNLGQVFADVEGVVVDLGGGGVGDQKQAVVVVLADVVAHRALDGLGLAEQHEAALVVVAVVVLVGGAPAGVAVVGLAVAVVDGAVGLVELEEGVLTAPGPDGGVVHGAVIALGVLARAAADVVLDEGRNAELGHDGVAAGLLHIVVADDHVGVAVLWP